MRDALSVGINTYQYLPKLKTPANDANAIATLLEQYGSFRVQRLPEVIREERTAVGRRTPVTLPELEAALIRLFKPSGSNVPQTALFYFSGHGIQRDAGIREGYLALSESQPEAGAAGLSLFWLRRLMQESPVRQRIVILDCCHSGELLTFSEADPGARPGTDRMFMVACREYEAAYESISGHHGVLTQAILDGLDPRCHAAGRVTNYSLTSAVSRALSAHSQTQQPLFENSGGEILLTSSSERLHPWAEANDYCPYPGLAPFDICHADYFFGRETLTRTLIDEVVTRPLVTLIGPSGCGKSSLLRAGLMAQMRRGQAFPESDRWRVRLIMPGDRPLTQLASAFIDPESTGLDRAEQLRRAEGFLQNVGPGLTQLLRGNLLKESASGLGARPRFVLIIDRFEELFTQCHSDRSQAERQMMIDALLYALRHAQDCFRLVLGLRADFLSRCLQNAALAEAMKPGLLRVLPFTYEQLKSAILKPAQKASLQCEPHLVYAILFDIVGAPGELPLLQYTLRELWKQRQQDTLTQSVYTSLGGVHGTLHTRASQVFKRLSPVHQDIAKAIFLALTQLGDGTEDTRRRVLKSYLLQMPYPAQSIEMTLEILVNEKLVVTSHQALGDSGHALNGDRNRETCPEASHAAANNSAPWTSPHAYGNGETVDIVHEALIRHWPLLQGWLSENRTTLRRQRSLEHAAMAWQQAGQLDRAEYLLQGSRLLDAEEFLAQPDATPTRTMQQYVALSRAIHQRSHWERRRLQFALPCFLIVTLLTGFSQYYGAAKERLLQTAQLRQSQSREQAAIAQAVLDDPNGDPTTALLIGKMALAQAPTAVAQTSVRQALTQLPLQTLTIGSSPITQIATSTGQIAIASADDTIHLWTSQSMPLQPMPLQGSPPNHILSASRSNSPESEAVSHLVFSADGGVIAAATEAVTGSTLIRLWSTAKGALLHEQEIDAPVTALALSSTGQRVAVATTTHLLRWETQSRDAAQPEKALLTVQAVRFKGDTALLALSGQTLYQWQLGSPMTAPVTRQLEAGPTPLNGAASQSEVSASFSADGTRLAIQAERAAQQLGVWQTANGSLQMLSRWAEDEQAPPCPVGEAQTLDQHHQYAAATATQGLQYYLCVKHLERIQLRYFKLRDAPTAIAFSQNSDYILAGDVSGTVRIWSLSEGELPTITAGQPVRWIRFASEDPETTEQGLRIDMVGLLPERRSARLIGTVDAGEISYQITPQGLTALPTSVSPALSAARAAASTTKQHASSTPTTPSISDQRSGQAPDGAIASAPVAWSSDGDQKLVIQGTTVRYQTASGQETLLHHDAEVISAHFSPSSAWIVVTEADRVTLWNRTTGQLVHQIHPPTEGDLTVADADPQSGQLIIGDNTGTIYFWDIPQSRLLTSFQAHTAALSALSFSPDGRRLASADRTGQARLWPVLPRSAIATNPLEFAIELADVGIPLIQLAFSPKGDYLALRDHRGQIHLRVSHPQVLETLSQSRVRRSLTVRECWQHLAPAMDCRTLDDG
ncbi:MAG: caspase family protein [Elainellaceae cyanobacterium]